ncbi:hypothetical protein [Hydrocarboniclastica marina]|uniref:Uncharacterized protein n=1 Tax=Hydrocarboniclastica marina TaxID=2259620 RepID=A0A4P7XII2_9ALTE|nr:hypothetical protein [Hydrocarboniclastica marina]QCF26828.1 hypothetical protein soil367_13290 [Hydrocarboniclastica marina]
MEMPEQARRHPAIRNMLFSGTAGAAAVCGAIAILGRTDSGSALAPINASSHIYWGPEAGEVEQPTLAQTVPGLAINIGASFWWAMVFELTFGRKLGQGDGQISFTKAIAGGLATAGLAYIVDYKLVPKRLTPGWEQRLSGGSVLAGLAALGLGIGAGAYLARQSSHEVSSHDGRFAGQQDLGAI